MIWTPDCPAHILVTEQTMLPLTATLNIHKWNYTVLFLLLHIYMEFGPMLRNDHTCMDSS
jgi:hypothetical protein